MWVNTYFCFRENPNGREVSTTMLKARAEFIGDNGFKQLSQDCTSIEVAVDIINRWEKKYSLLFAWVVQDDYRVKAKKIDGVWEIDSVHLPSATGQPVVQAVKSGGKQPDGKQPDDQNPHDAQHSKLIPAVQKYSADDRQNALELVAKYGIPMASKKTGISIATLHRWANKAGIQSVVDMEDDAAAKREAEIIAMAANIKKNGGGAYPPETRRQVLQIVSEIGIYATARLTGIAHNTLTKWRKDAGMPVASSGVRYSKKTKQKAVSLIRKQGAPVTYRAMKPSYETMNRWRQEAGIEPLTSGVNYDQETRQHALELMEEIGIAETSLETGISITCLTNWRVEAGIPAQEKAKAFDEETKQRAIEIIKRDGIEAAANSTGINRKLLRSWESRIEHPPLPKGYRHSDGVRKKALALIPEIGIEKTALELGVSSFTLYKWRLQAGMPEKYINRYDEETKRTAMERACEIGIRPASREMGMSDTELRKWINDANELNPGSYEVYNCRGYGEKVRKEALDRIGEIGIEATSLEIGISKATLRKWWKKAHPEEQLLSYDEEMKQKALKRFQEIGATATAQEFGISINTLLAWRKKADEINPGSFPIKKHIVYDEETKLRVQARIREIGLMATMRETGIGKVTLIKWKKEMK